MSAPQGGRGGSASSAQKDARPADPPRKRRKRAPAAGATADCFTCITLGATCDRRRPYCTQCLDDGKDCAGYKTQLTWGNGVASRGKLRGLSLPVAGTKKLATPNSPPPSKRRSSQHELPPPPLSYLNLSKVRTAPGACVFSPESATFQQDRSQHAYPAPDTYAPPAAAWPPIFSNPGLQTESVRASTSTTSSTNPASPLDGFAFGLRLDPGIAYNGSDDASPLSYSPPPPSESANLEPVTSQEPTASMSTLATYPVSPQFMSPYKGAFPDHDHYGMPPGHMGPYSSGAPRLQPHPSSDLGQITYRLPEEELEEGLDDAAPTRSEEDCAVMENKFMVGFPQISLNHLHLSVSPFSGRGAIGATPRMQYLVNYYTEVISPVIVAFDSPSNPYRTKILQLAATSEMLQHALCALAGSNLRQRRDTELSTCKTDPARRSSIAHQTLTSESWHKTGLFDLREEAREESLHKGAAIQSLNKQLADPVLRKHDSTLATLLILCLFHACDSGVARFQTQFAGVKKLLSLRQSDLGLKTKESTWLTRMFFLFDALAATVNDRQAELHGHPLDTSALADEEWTLETLAGCDGQLFKIIARLGRLNVLSQGHTVERDSSSVSQPMPPMPHEQNPEYRNVDGNGWMHFAQDEGLCSANSADLGLDSLQFWREWRETRRALQTWQLDPTILDASRPQSSPSLSYDQRYDLANISESFRHSALLYTERLAHPKLSSADPAIRSWVQKCLMYIKAVKADVYLLWPLFITGSECVDAADRAVIRQRCLDIQKDSGFLNNKSCLELLEKLWRREDKGQRDLIAGSPLGLSSGPCAMDDTTGFRFRTIMKMENLEGEYIVV